MKECVKYKDVTVSTNSALYEALKNKDMKLAEKLYQEANKEYCKYFQTEKSN